MIDFSVFWARARVLARKLEIWLCTGRIYDVGIVRFYDNDHRRYIREMSIKDSDKDTKRCEMRGTNQMDGTKEKRGETI